MEDFSTRGVTHSGACKGHKLGRGRDKVEDTEGREDDGEEDATREKSGEEGQEEEQSPTASDEKYVDYLPRTWQY